MTVRDTQPRLVDDTATGGNNAASGSGHRRRITSAATIFITVLGLAYLILLPFGMLVDKFTTTEVIIIAIIFLFNSVLISNIESLSISDNKIELKMKPVIGILSITPGCADSMPSRSPLWTYDGYAASRHQPGCHHRPGGAP